MSDELTTAELLAQIAAYGEFDEHAKSIAITVKSIAYQFKRQGSVSPRQRQVLMSVLENRQRIARDRERGVKYRPIPDEYFLHGRSRQAVKSRQRQSR